MNAELIEWTAPEGYKQTTMGEVRAKNLDWMHVNGATNFGPFTAASTALPDSYVVLAVIPPEPPPVMVTIDGELLERLLADAYIVAKRFSEGRDVLPASSVEDRYGSMSAIDTARRDVTDA